MSPCRVRSRFKRGAQGALGRRGSGEARTRFECTFRVQSPNFTPRCTHHHRRQNYIAIKIHAVILQNAMLLYRCATRLHYHTIASKGPGIFQASRGPRLSMSRRGVYTCW